MRGLEKQVSRAQERKREGKQERREEETHFPAAPYQLQKPTKYVSSQTNCLGKTNPFPSLGVTGTDSKITCASTSSGLVSRYLPHKQRSGQKKKDGGRYQLTSEQP